MSWAYILPESEIEYIAKMSQEWLGADAALTVSANKDSPSMWNIENSEYRIIIGSHPDDRKTYFNIFPKSEDFIFPKLNLSLAEHAVANDTERPWKWEDSFLNNKIPKLTDKLTTASYNSNKYSLYWKYMDLAETELVIKNIISSFDGEYEYGIGFGEKRFVWDLEGEINGKHATVVVSYFLEVQEGYQTYITFVI